MAVFDFALRKKGVYGVLHIIILLLSLFLVISISIDTFKNIPFYTQTSYKKIQLWICLFFLFDFVLEFFLSKDKLRYLRTHFIFLLVAIPYQNIMLRRIIAFLGDLSLCSRPHFAALRLLYLTLQATVQVAYLIINIIELQFSPCTFLLPIREIFIPFPGFSRYDVPFTNHFLSSFHCFFVGFPCFPLRKCIAIPLFHYATFCFRMSDLLNTSVSGDSSKTVRLVIIVCT